MISLRRILVINALVLLLLLGGGVAAWYAITQSASYLTTDKARVDGQRFVLVAPASGELIDWNGSVGKTYRSGETVGHIRTVTADMRLGRKPVAQDVAITLPMRGTLVQQNAVPHAFVAAGTPLAYAYDLEHLWITAQIDETDLPDVKIGQDVDVYLDAYPDVTLKGTVSAIGLATSDTFSLLPVSDEEETRTIPVTITLNGTSGLRLVPGLSATVRIHKS